MNAVRSELTAEEMTDLRTKLLILESSIKKKIAGNIRCLEKLMKTGSDGLVDVYEFNAVTSKYGWPQGMFSIVTEIEESYHK